MMTFASQFYEQIFGMAKYIRLSCKFVIDRMGETAMEADMDEYDI